MMRPRFIPVALALLTFPLLVRAQSPGPVPPERAGSCAQEQAVLAFDYNVYLDWFFVNDEFDASGGRLSPSRTMCGVRVTPAVGLRIRQEDGATHRLLCGIDLLKDFGASPIGWGAETDLRAENWNLFREVSLYYRYGRRFGKTDFSATAGVYPRHLTQGRYSTAILSDAVRIYDSNLEGVLFQLRRPRSFVELGLDWKGKYGVDRRERFDVFTYGEARITDWVRFAWQGMFQHYASCEHVQGVVDEDFLNPYFQFDLAGRTGLQELWIAVGPFLSYQNDRRLDDVRFPLGADAVFCIRNWNVSLKDEFYYGSSLMPFYGRTDEGGIPYGSNLYQRAPFWRIDPEHPEAAGAYNRLEIAWTKDLSRFLQVRAFAVAHFSAATYCGWQQIVTLSFDLDALRYPARPPFGTSAK